MLKLQYMDSGADAVWLAQPGVSIGNDASSTLVLAGDDVEGFHADILVSKQGVFVEDVGTLAGTFVNDVRIDGPVEIHGGDVLSVGGVGLIVVDPHMATSTDATVHGAAAPGPEDIGGATWALLALNGPLAGHSFALKARTTVGRADGCDLSIPEARLSRAHAQFDLNGHLLSVQDLESLNGTYHNGRRVERAVLAVGDEVAFDKLRFRVVGPSA